MSSNKNHRSIKYLLIAMLFTLFAFVFTTVPASADSLQQTFTFTGVKNGEQKTLVNNVDISNHNQPPFRIKFDPNSYTDLTLTYTVTNPSATQSETILPSLLLPSESGQVPPFLIFDGTRQAKLSGDGVTESEGLSYHYSSDANGQYESDFKASDAANIKDIRASDTSSGKQSNFQLGPKKQLVISIPLTMNPNNDLDDYGRSSNPTAGADAFTASTFVSTTSDVSRDLSFQYGKQIALSDKFIPVVRDPGTDEFNTSNDQSLLDLMPNTAGNVKTASSISDIDSENPIYDDEFVAGGLRSANGNLFQGITKDGYYLNPFSLFNGDYAKNDYIYYLLPTDSSGEGNLTMITDVSPDGNINYNLAPYLPVKTSDGREPQYVPLTQGIKATDFKVDNPADLSTNQKFKGLEGLFDPKWGMDVSNPDSQVDGVSVAKTSDSHVYAVTYTYSGISKTVRATVASTVDKSEIDVSKSFNVDAGSNWSSEQFKGISKLIDPNGNSAKPSTDSVTVSIKDAKTGKTVKTVDTKTPGATYEVTYTYFGKTSKPVKVTVVGSVPTPSPVTPSGNGGANSSSTTPSPTTPSTPATPTNPLPNTPTTPSNNLPNYAAVKKTVIYGTKSFYMYKHPTFKKSQRVAKYMKAKRANRPMFVITGYARSNNGALRYKVRDVNHGRKSAGKVGYITANPKYVVNVYYKTMPKNKKITVIAKNVHAYQHQRLTGRTKTYKKGTHLTVKKLVKHNLTTRYQLSNGYYVTANKKLVIQGNH